MQAAVEPAQAEGSGPAATGWTRKRDAVAGEAYTALARAGTEDKQLVADRQAEACAPEEAAAGQAAPRTTCSAEGCSNEQEAAEQEYRQSPPCYGQHLQVGGGWPPELSKRCLRLRQEVWRSSSAGDPVA